MKWQKGFTLIELVVVMVILGILSAFAIPKFYDFRNSAGGADVNGAAGALNSASVTSHGAALATGATGATGSITMEGTAVSLVYGYPAASSTGIGAAVNISLGTGTGTFTASSSGSTYIYVLNGATDGTNCRVTYTQATASSPATVAALTSGC